MRYCGTTGKQSHDTEARARKHLRHVSRRFGYRGSVYQCRACKGWHVGSVKPPIQLKSKGVCQ